MTWPFENDTSAVIKKLAKRNLKTDKSRNILIIITIALAAWSWRQPCTFLRPSVHH